MGENETFDIVVFKERYVGTIFDDLIDTNHDDFVDLWVFIFIKATSLFIFSHNLYKSL